MTDDDYKSRLTFSYLVGVQSHITSGISTLDGLIPMFAPVLHSFAGQFFEPARVAEVFTSTYGAQIHPYAIASISQKLFKAGYLVENGRDVKNNSVIYRVSSSIEVAPTAGELQVDSLFLTFREFANAQAELHALPRFDNDELDIALISRLQSFPLPDQHSLRIRNEGANKVGGGLLTLPKYSKIDDERIHDERKKQWLNAIFSDYALNKVDSGSADYELFQKIATGSILVEAVLNFCGPKAEKNLQNTWFLIDTPLLMDLLDLDSPERNKFAKAMFEQLVDANAKLAVFEHSIVEIGNNIKAAIDAYSERRSHGSIGIRMIENSDFVHRIASVKQNLVEEIKALGFTIFKAPATLGSFSYLSQDLENQLANNIGPYKMDAARLRDSSSIASIVRMRQNHKSARQNLSKTNYVFVTRNSRLAQMSEDFLLAQRIYQADEMPACITDSSLAAVLWLMFGALSSSSLPYKRLLANCTAIPQMDQHIRDRVVNLIADDNSELAKSFQVWSRTPRGAEVMLRKSLGDPNLVTMDNLAEFVDSIKSAAGSEAADLVKSEMNEQLYLSKLAHAKSDADHEEKRLDILAKLEDNTLELEGVKSQLAGEINSNARSLISLREEFADVRAELLRSAELREKDNDGIFRALIQRMPKIQKTWDLVFGISAGIIAASLAICACLFDKYYTISHYWDTKFLILLIVFSGILTTCVYGPIPTFLFQDFINRRKQKFLDTQLLLVGKESLRINYDIDFAAHTFTKRIQ